MALAVENPLLRLAMEEDPALRAQFSDGTSGTNGTNAGNALMANGNPLLDFAMTDDPTLGDRVKLRDYVRNYNAQNPETPITEADIPDRSGVVGRVSELAHGVATGVADTFPMQLAQAWQGADVPLDASSFPERVIRHQQKDIGQRVLSRQEILGEQLGKALSQGPQSMATSAATGITGAVVGGLAGGKIGAGIGALAGAPAGGVGAAPGAGVGAATGGVVGSMVGAAALTLPAFWRMAENQLLRQWLDQAEAHGVKITQEEWEQFKAEQHAEISKYGFYEAAPEALSSALGAGIFKGVGGRIFGRIPGFEKVAQRIAGNTLARLSAKYGGIVAEEEATELMTSMGQTRVEAKLGLRDRPATVGEILTDQAGAVAVGALLQSGGMHLALGEEKTHTDKPRTVTDSILRPAEPVTLPPEGLGELPAGTGQERAIAARFSPTIAEARRITPELAGVEERLTAANARLKEAQDQAADFASTSDNMEGLQPILEARDRAAAEVRTLENEHAGRASEALERRIAIGEEHIAGLQERIGREQDETSRDVLEDDFARATDRIEALRGHLGEIRDAQARGDYGAGVIEKQAGDLRLEAGGTEGQQGREGTTKGAEGAKREMPPEGEKGVKGAGAAKPPRPGVPGEQEAVAKELMEVQGRLAKEYPETNQETMWDLPRAARTEYEGLTGREAELKARMREILAAQAAARTQTGQGGEINAETIRGNAGLPGEAGNVAAGGPGAGGEVVQRAPEAGAGAGNAVGEVTGPKPLTAGQKRIAESFVRTLPEGAPAVAPGAAETILPAAEERLAGLRTAVDQAADKVRRRGNQLKRKNLKPERRVFYREEYAAAERELEAARKELGEAEKEAGGGNRTDQADRTNLEAGKPPTGSETQPAPGETRASAAGKRIAATPESAKGLERAVRDLVVQSGARVRVRISEEAPYLTTEEALRYPEGSDVRAAGERGRAAGKAATTTRKFASINLETGEVKIFKDGTLLDAVHEIAHWFREKPGIFTLRERTAIEAAFPGDWNGERFARAAEDWWKKQGGKEGTTEGAKGTKSLLERAYRKFVEFLKNVGDALGLRDLTVGDVYGRMYRGEMKGRLEGQLRGGALVTGELHQAEEARRLRDLDEHFPVDTVAPELLDTKRGNAEILQSAADLMKSWPEKVTAADGAEILLHNPQGGLLSARVYHMLRDGRTGAIHKEKAAWLPNVPETLKNAAARLYDDENQTHIYVRGYEDGTKHFVVVAPDGQVSDQIITKGRLITQFPRTATGKQWGMRVVWERGDATGQVPGHPGATPRASMILDSQRGEFQEGLSQGKGGEVKGKERLQAGPLREQAASVRKEAAENPEAIKERRRENLVRLNTIEALGRNRALNDGTESGKWLVDHPEVGGPVMRASERFIPGGGFVQRQWDNFRRVLRSMRGAFPHVETSMKALKALTQEKLGQINRALDDLRIQKTYKQRSAEWTVNTQRDVILKDLQPRDYGLFQRAAAIRNLVVEAERKLRRTGGDAEQAKRLPLPFNLSLDALRNLEAAVNRDLAKNPGVAAALERRDAVFQQAAQDLVARGLLDKEQGNNPHYFHQIGLEYAQGADLAQLMGSGDVLKIAQGRGYQKHRYLNAQAYSLDVLKVDNIIMSQVMLDTMNYDLIHEKLLGDSVAKADKAWLLAEADRRTTHLRERNPKAPPVSLSEILEDRPDLAIYAEHPGMRIFGNRTLRKDLMAEIVERVMHSSPGAKQMIGVTADDLKMGATGEKYEWGVLPKDLVDQLRDMNNEDFLGTANVVSRLMEPTINAWKQAMLFPPTRVVRYNINNTMGDGEHLLESAGLAPFKGGAAWKRTLGDIWGYFIQGKEASPRMRRMLDGGVLSGTITAGEIRTSLHDMPGFEKFYRAMDDPGIGIRGTARKMTRMLYDVSLGWGKTASMAREAMLRYKAWDWAIDILDNGGTMGKEIPWGASRAIEFTGLGKEAAAAKWAREQLGDYDNISAFGQMMRKGPFPFFSWTEVNLKMYKHLFENAFIHGDGPWQRKLFLATAPARKLVGGLAVWTIGVWLWNMLMLHDDEEAQKGLSKYVKQRGYLAVGPPTAEHAVRYTRVASASRDLMEWIGVGEWPDVWQDVKSGQMGVPEALFSVPKATVNKLVGGLGPWKSAVEIAFGKTTFPDVFEPKAIRETDQAVAQMWGVGEEYKWLKNWFSPVPRRGGGDYILNLLAIKKNDPGLASYNEIIELKFRFEEKVLDRGSSAGDYYTEKSSWARQLRLARKYGDERAEDRIVERLGELGVRPGQVRELLKGADPLRGLSRANRRAFEDWLTPEQRDKLEMAETYYQETFR